MKTIVCLSYACDNEHRRIFPRVLQDRDNGAFEKNWDGCVPCIKEELGGNQQLMKVEAGQRRLDTGKLLGKPLLVCYLREHRACAAIRTGHPVTSGQETRGLSASRCVAAEP